MKLLCQFRVLEPELQEVLLRSIASGSLERDGRQVVSSHADTNQNGAGLDVLPEGCGPPAPLQQLRLRVQIHPAQGRTVGDTGGLVGNGDCARVGLAGFRRDVLKFTKSAKLRTLETKKQRRDYA